jgi:hypothetical protein
LHPSPSFKSTSSHYSSPIIKPSPHKVKHVLLIAIHGWIQPPQRQLTLQIYKVHVEEHPSWSNKFPSSHFYEPLCKPSPQVVEHVVLSKGKLHPSHEQFTSQPSIKQVKEHPSLSMRFPSSHCSEPLSKPSPQTEVHELFTLTHGAVHPSQEQFRLQD